MIQDMNNYDCAGQYLGSQNIHVVKILHRPI
jgi:hypothetical protein